VLPPPEVLDEDELELDDELEDDELELVEELEELAEVVNQARMNWAVCTAQSPVHLGASFSATGGMVNLIVESFT
jgi:hypothetical protein